MRNTPLLAFAALLGLLVAPVHADIADRLDQPAAEITASTWWNGAALRLDTLRSKVVVLHVSDPSRTTSNGFVPNLAKLVAAYKDKPVVFLEIVEHEDEAVAKKYLSQFAEQVSWQVGWDGTGAIQRGYPGSSLPRTYLIGPDGRIAWHAHIMALTRSLMDAQLTRCAFSDVKNVPERARPAAKAMLEMKFADAIVAADKVFADRFAGDDARAFCAGVKKEIARYYAFQKSVVDTLIKELDWAVAYQRVERMLVTYKATDHEPDVQRIKDELDANPRVKYIVAAQKRLDEMVKDLGRLSAKDLAKLIAELKSFVDQFPETAVGTKAGEWLAEAERRFARKSGGK